MAPVNFQNFDVEGARSAGYSDADIANQLSQQQNYDASGARQAGYNDQDIIRHLEPSQAFKYDVGRMPENNVELSDYQSNPDNWAHASTQPNHPLHNLKEGAIGVAGAAAGMATSVVPGAVFIGRTAGETANYGLLKAGEFRGQVPQGTADRYWASAHQDARDQFDYVTGDQMSNFWRYMPGGESQENVDAANSMGQVATDLGSLGVIPAVKAAVPGVLRQAGASDQTIQNVEAVGGDIGRAASALPILGVPAAVRGVGEAALARTAARATAKEAAAAAAEATVPNTVPTSAVTAEQLQAEPNPIPQPNADAPTAPSTLAVQKPKIVARAGESAQQAAARQGIFSAAPETAEASTQPAPTPAQSVTRAPAQSAPTRLFYPPQEDGPQFATKNSESDVTARRETLRDVNPLGGNLMTNDRRGAVTGDWDETGNEYQTAKIPDAPGQLLRDQIASENQTLHNATQAQHDATGTEALNNVDRDTLEQRGGVVRDAIHAIEDHFNGAANGFYATARAVMGDRPMMTMPRVQQILLDASHDVNPTAASLRSAAQTKLQQLWSVGDTRGNVRTLPATVGAAERFHEFLNESKHNDSASLVRKLKNATDLDIAENTGGSDLFKAARNVIQHRETMLEPDGVNELRRPKDRNKIDNEVAKHEIMDHVVNQDSEHFEHFMNVLRAGAHLSPEVAAKSAAATREIQAHMIAKMHTAARGDGGAWNARNFYKAANRFSTNMPAAFRGNPGVLENLRTINRAGNILKMDRSYPGAVAQAAKVGLLPQLAMKVVKGAKLTGEVGGAAHMNPVIAFGSHFGGKMLESGVDKLTARSRLAKARESLIPRGVGAPGIPARASGGPVSAGQPYVVGERGPEVVVPRTNGVVIPNLRPMPTAAQLTKYAHLQFGGDESKAREFLLSKGFR